MSNRGILDADMRTIGRWIDNGLRWWLAELGGLVPQRLRDWTSPRRLLADYEPTSGEILTRLKPKVGYPSHRAPIAVVLPADLYLTRVIERPVMTQRDLDGMILLECDRIMPLAAGDAILAAQILSRSADNRRMQVEVAAIPRAAAEALGGAVARMMRPCLSVLTQTPEPHKPKPIDFLPALRRAGLIGNTHQAASALWLCAGFLLAFNIGLLVWRDSVSVQNLDDIISQQQPAVDAAHRIQAQTGRIERIIQTTNTQRRNAEPIAMMAVLQSSLPPGAWLQRLDWRGTTLRISGYRPANADISAALHRSGFAVTRYSDTTSTAQDTLGQPFEITLRIRTP